jgi:hypothetical protein
MLASTEHDLILAVLVLAAIALILLIWHQR